MLTLNLIYGHNIERSVKEPRCITMMFSLAWLLKKLDLHLIE